MIQWNLYNLTFDLLEFFFFNFLFNEIKIPIANQIVDVLDISYFTNPIVE